MGQSQDPGAAKHGGIDAVRALERALDEATERLRVARRAVKDAKVAAKAAKKDRKRARNTLKLAQQEFETVRTSSVKAAPDTGTEAPESKSDRRIAASPEKKRTATRKKVGKAVAAAESPTSLHPEGTGSQHAQLTTLPPSDSKKDGGSP
jgi:hypothetical protein